jgi:CBS domain-containing protein
MAKFTALPLVSMDSNLNKPRPVGLLHLEDPATEVYVDFAESRCRAVSQSDKLEYAEYILQRDRSHELIVEDNDRHVVGILSTTDVIGPKALTAASKQRVAHDELLVKAVMTPLEQIPVIDNGILVHAKIGNIIKTMNENKAKFLLVVKESDDGHELCGLFSLLSISQQLHRDVAKAAGIPESILELKNQ